MSSSGTCTTHGEEDAGPEPLRDDDGVGSNPNAADMETAHEPPFAQMGQANAACSPAIVRTRFYLFFSSFSFPFQTPEHSANTNTRATTGFRATKTM